MTSPNGIGLSPDGTVLYVAETATGPVVAIPGDRTGVIDTLPHPSPNGGALVLGIGGFVRFDSLAVTASGRVCVATLDIGGISDIHPETGIVRHVPFADSFVTNICFGGPEMRTAFVTLSQTGKLIATTWREAGLRLHHQPV